jgi:hypothetical protein
MSETITEMIIPGTYIEVRAEGLIGVSGVAAGNVGIVGTAAKGPLDEVVVLTSFSDARDVFGDYDGWVDGSSSELTLVRALQQGFNNGASTVYAVRTGAAEAAGLTLSDGTGPVLRIVGRTPGTWAREISASVKAATSNGFVEDRRQSVTGAPLQPLHANITPSQRNTVRITRGATGKVVRLALATTGAPQKGRRAVVSPADGVLTFHADDVPVAGDTLRAAYEVDKSACRQLDVKYRNVTESYTAIDATDLKRDIDAASTLVKVEIQAGGDARAPSTTTEALLLDGGDDGANADGTAYATSLAKLDPEPINIVLLAGRKFSDAVDSLKAHIESNESAGRDRIGVLGADGDGADTVAANADSVASGRLILVAPGIKVQDLALGRQVALPAAYAAAAVAGLIASLSVQVSPTNKTLAVAGLSKDYNDGELKKLLGARVMALEKKSGFRVVKGITTDDGAFRQVSVRRVVDFAKAGTRIGSLPYIGRLNNARVRGALKATLNGFLSDMVIDEKLIGFTLDVSATRAQEIAGVAVVTMFLQPTFSIDYIKVIMNLS